MKKLALVVATSFIWLTPQIEAADSKPYDPVFSKKHDPILIQETERNADGKFAAYIVLQQYEIATTYDVGRVAADAGGGTFGNYYIRKNDNKAAILADSLNDKAEANAKPLRQVLEGFDVRALAQATTAKALAAPGWFTTRALVEKSVEISPVFTYNTNVSFAYKYEMSPDFSSLRAYADIQLKGPARSKPSKTGTMLYWQRVTSVIQLRKRSMEHSENVAIWSADQGKLAKAAITEAFVQMEELIPHALNLTVADIKAYTAKDREQAFAGGYNGPLIKRGGRHSDDVLIWTNGLLKVHTLP